MPFRFCWGWHVNSSHMHVSTAARDESWDGGLSGRFYGLSICGRLIGYFRSDVRGEEPEKHDYGAA